MTKKVNIYICLMFLCGSTYCAEQKDSKINSTASFAMQYNMSKDLKTPVEKQIEVFCKQCCSNAEPDKEKCIKFKKLYTCDCEKKDPSG